MLVLTRAKDESVLIEDNIKITVLSIHNSEIELRVEAPKNFSITRSEMAIPLIVDISPKQKTRINP